MAVICFQSPLEKQGPHLDSSVWIYQPGCNHLSRGRKGREVGWCGRAGLSAKCHPANGSQDVLQPELVTAAYNGRSSGIK